MKLSEKDFDRIVKKTIRSIPQEIQQYLDNIVISVKKRPSKKMLQEMGLSPEEPLLGIYDGVSLMDRSVTSPPLSSLKASSSFRSLLKRCARRFKNWKTR
jgi:predicted Zn-dependent protease with MMP-like domain